MNILFENKTTVKKEIISEFAKETFKVYGKKYRLFVLLMHILSIIFAVVTLISYGLTWFPVLFFMFSLFFLFMFFKAYVIKFKDNYINLKGLHGELPEVTVRFYKDRFESATVRSNLNIEYSKITRIIETDNLYLLMIEKQGIMLTKNGFTIGDIESFKLFIKDKIFKTVEN